MATKQNFYLNPAFCQQSEIANNYPPRVLSPKNVRHSPVGAQCIPQNIDQGPRRSDIQQIDECLEEQEFYEEVLVDDKGFITDKKFVVVAQNNEGKKYIQVPQNDDRYGSRYGLSQSDDRKGARYGVPTPTKPKLARSQSQRYEYIQMQEQNVTPKKQIQYHEELEVSPGRVHRYAVIEADEETELTTRYALVPVDHLTNLTTSQQQISTPNRNRYEYIQDQTLPSIPQSSIKSSRYEYIPASPQKPQTSRNYTQQSPMPNPAATKKLHEILSTPKKTNNVLSPQSSRKLMPPSISPIAKDFQTKSMQKLKKPPPKAQQKLNYAIAAKQLAYDKRHTAIVAPMCSSPIQSVYSETTFSKSDTWSNLSVRNISVQATITFSALLMLLCGCATSGLSFYMIYIMDRKYFLDFGVVAGFTCLVLGLLGFRSRNMYWLPNRNYISGYIVLSIFSLLTCVALLVLLIKHPKPGTPLADMTSVAVCGFSVLSLVLAAMGAVSSYCCKYPPPDNRVQHCAEGFSV
ncbi:uncharacterized protein LOC130893686 [Diorhabda carinulata]|uniref:uncharacterized protein LOC130893686 n=1 Tax=Diorhabda carinulata TaxID=1163345 RepID=UPI0025A0FE42|nr:uncharacterized protein LOC130893686 [Diorhabda carinulata]